MSFSEYMEITEKVMSGDQSKSLYIATEFDKEQVKKYYDMIDLEGDAVEEVETTPHATILYSSHVKGITKDTILNAMRKLWQGVTFDVIIEGYTVFEDVNQGTQDVLVMDLGIEDIIYKIQEQIVPTIKELGGEIKVSYPDWKPHMTIAYFTKGKVPQYPKTVEPMTLKVKDIFLQFGGSDTEKILL
jgi:2'-5' RNA ligase